MPVRTIGTVLLALARILLIHHQVTSSALTFTVAPGPFPLLQQGLFVFSVQIVHVGAVAFSLVELQGPYLQPPLVLQTLRFDEVAIHDRRQQIFPSALPLTSWAARRVIQIRPELLLLLRHLRLNALLHFQSLRLLQLLKVRLHANDGSAELHG